MRALWLAAPLLASVLLVLALAPSGEVHAATIDPERPGGDGGAPAPSAEPHAATIDPERPGGGGGGGGGAPAPSAEEHPPTPVPPGWQLIPSGIDKGDSFRLLFVTHHTTQMWNLRGLDKLDNHVQDVLEDRGLNAIRPYADEFKAVASCGGTDARHHTSTTYSSSHPGVPIYWLGGHKVADDYRDFYDGSWDSHDPRDEQGTGWPGRVTSVWTGTNSDGTSASRHHACYTHIKIGSPSTSGQELSYSYKHMRYSGHVYGLSPVFTVSHAPSAPSAPTIVSATHDSVTIRWNAPVHPGTTPVFDYNVDIKRTGQLHQSDRPTVVPTIDNGLWHGSTPYHWGTGTTHTITGLTHDMEYQVRVLAKNHSADPTGSNTEYSSWSPATTFRTQTIAPSAPGNLTVTPSDTTAVLRWSPPTWHGATPIHDYDVFVKRAGGSWTESNPAVHGTGTSTTLTGLSANTTYQVHVRANNHGTDQSGAGSSTLRGPWSSAATFRTLPPIATVPDDWALLPDGLEDGEKFRLLFVTTSTRNAVGYSDTFNRFVQGVASNGHDAISPHASEFRALMSLDDRNALTNTFTTHSSDNPGVPIYWLNGSKIADDYADFWDGCWDSNEPRSELGLVLQAPTVWTESKSDGTHANTSPWYLTHYRDGKPAEHCREIYADRSSRVHSQLHMYGLSPVFTTG